MTNTSCLPSSLRGAIGLFPFETLKFEAGWITQQTSCFVARETHPPVYWRSNKLLAVWVFFAATDRSLGDAIIHLAVFRNVGFLKR